MTNIYKKGSEWRKWDLHVHTASSYDAYKGDDADDLLSKAWKVNEVSAAAITDHFVIDYKRIVNLRKLNPHMTIFPGVELRTDKGAANLHVIIIFPESIDLVRLSNAFNVVMIERTAKAKESDHTIYWDFEDIVDFAKDYNGLISLHTGSKSNGMDQVITNAMPVNLAIKTEIANKVHFYEIGNISDVKTHYDKIFPHIGEKPLILCSDNHNPHKYEFKDLLWIKADLTYEGLVQAINHPIERIFIGDIPKKLDKSMKNKRTYIDFITVNKSTSATNTSENWFNFNVPINSGLTTVIGSKGSGKSAIADIIGHLCKSNAMKEASFLNTDRFRKSPKNLAKDYIGSITWLDGQKSEEYTLDFVDYGASIQEAQYLPQKYIERVCTDLGNEFQKEINNVIFSYVDSTEKGDAKNLYELMQNKTTSNIASIRSIQSDLEEINTEIIKIESRLTAEYKSNLIKNLEKCENDLVRHLANKPEEVNKPLNSFSEEDQKELTKTDEGISKLEEQLEENKAHLTQINMKITKLNNLKKEIELIVGKIESINSILDNYASELEFESKEFKIAYTVPLELVDSKLYELNQTRETMIKVLDNTDKADVNISLYRKLDELNNHRKEIISKADAKEKLYQKYQDDLKEWNRNREKLIGDANIEGSIEYYKAEIQAVENDYIKIYDLKKQDRIDKIREIYEEKKKIANIYAQIYEPIEVELERLLGQVGDKIEFTVNVEVTDMDIPSKLLSYVNQSYSGTFNGKTESLGTMNKFLKDTNFDDIESAIRFIDNVLGCVYEDIDRSSLKIKNKLEFYRLITNLEYIDVVYSLKMSGSTLQELSPGERGIVLLVFYLALSKDEVPLIIDQPEDNLDNESVYYKLVPCICEAKKRRQVIIVTHNPNIAIACDAEQIIYCKMNKQTNEITYTSGSIENPQIRSKIIDVLEGTIPAFDLRKRKYLVK